MSPKDRMDAESSAARIVDGLDKRYSKRLQRGTATITGVTRDSAGRASAAIATIDGSPNQSVSIDHGSSIAVGDVFQAVNAGSVTMPMWRLERRLHTIQSEPGQDQTPTLPTPTGLELERGLYTPDPGGNVAAWIYACWHTIPSTYGAVSYDVQYGDNDHIHDPAERTTKDPGTITQLAVDVDDTVTVIPFVTLWGGMWVMFARYNGRVKLAAEEIDYTDASSGEGDSGTGTGGTNMLTDSGKSWTPDQWVDFGLVDSAGDIFRITGNDATTLTVIGNPASGTYDIWPALVGCTRGVGGTDAAAHGYGTGLSSLSWGLLIENQRTETDYNVRVRARNAADAISAWTSWASIQTDADFTIPPVPTGFAVADAVGGVLLTWTGPTINEVPDLAGFYIYRATDDIGTGSTKVDTIGVRTQTKVYGEYGVTYYYSISSYDTSLNESAKTSWLPGMAIIGTGVQLLTNADLERCFDDSSEPDDYLVNPYTASFNYGAHGVEGTAGVRFTLPDDTHGSITWPHIDKQATRKVFAEDGQTYTWSVYFHTTVDPSLFAHAWSTGDPPDGKLSIWCNVVYCSGVNGVGYIFPYASGEGVRLEPLGDDWYRLSYTTVYNRREDALVYIGWYVDAYNRTGSEVVVSIDRPQMEQGVLSAWHLAPVPPTGSSTAGISFDPSGLVSQELLIDPDGRFQSDLVPTPTETHDIGQESLRWNTIRCVTLEADNISGEIGHSPVSLDTSLDANLLDISGQTLSLDTQSANTLFAGPASGGAAAPAFRSMAEADLAQHDILTKHTISGSQWDLVGHGGVGLALLPASDDPGQAAKILRTDAAGKVTLYALDTTDDVDLGSVLLVDAGEGTVGVNFDPSSGNYGMVVTASTDYDTALSVRRRSAAATAEILQIDDEIGQTWWLVDRDGNFESSNFSTGIRGVQLTPDGDAEMGNVKIRGSITASAFTAETQQVAGGYFMVAEGAVLYEDLIVEAGPTPPTIPTLAFSADVTEGESPLEVTFNNSSTDTGDTSKMEWDIDNDGVYEYEYTGGDLLNSCVHTYEEDGLYSVTLRATYNGSTTKLTKTDYILVSTAPPPPTDVRVTDNLQVLYEFEDGSGATVTDTSGVGTAYNLTISNTGVVEWGSNYLELLDEVVITGSGTCSKVIDACKTSNEVSMELWVEAALNQPYSNARWLHLGDVDPINLEASLCDDNDPSVPSAYRFDIRTSTTDDDGIQRYTEAGTRLATLQHVVYTRASDGTVQLYINGVERAPVSDITGNFSTWVNYPLRLGARNDGRGMLGRLYLVAIYSDVLTAAEVLQNFNAGPGDDQPPPPDPPPLPDPDPDPPQPQGPCYYVDKDGNDSYDGSYDSPWRTIGEACRKVQAGDSVYIRPGTYNEQLRPYHSGTSADKPIMFLPDPEFYGVPTIGGTSGENRCVDLSDREYIYLVGLNIKWQHGAMAFGSEKWPWVYMNSGTRYCEIWNCEILLDGSAYDWYASDLESRCIEISGSHGCTISGCTLGGHNMGIHHHDGGTYNTIQYNTFWETGRDNLHISSAGGHQHLLVRNNHFMGSVVSDGIQCNGSDSNAVQDCWSIIIKDNVFGPALSGGALFGENAIDLKGAKYVLIEGNVIFGTIGSSDGPFHEDGWNRNAPAAISRGTGAYASNITIRNNLVVDCCGGPSIMTDDQENGPDNLAIYNNTIIGNNRDYTGSNSDFSYSSDPSRRIFSAIRSKSNPNGSVVINNIMAAHRHVEFHARWSGSGEKAWYDYNLYYNPDQTVKFAYGYPPTNVTGLSAWQTYLSGQSQVEGNEANSMVDDPEFVSGPFKPDCEVTPITDFDYSLKSTSPALNAGTYVAKTTSGGSGTVIPVDRIQCFCDGMGRIDGDTIKVGSSGWVQVVNVDWDNDRIEVDQAISWSSGDPIYQYYYGSGPDIGAYQRET